MDVDTVNHNSGNTPSMETLRQQLSELRSAQDNLSFKQRDLQRQLEKIQKDLDAAHHAAAAKESQINERKNSLNLIVSLPAEILSSIFLHVIEFPQGDPEITRFPMSLMLSSVCRRWRTVVLGDPRLWTHVTLEHSGRYNLEPYLSRSGDSGLDISFIGGWHTHAGPLLDQLGKEAPRWRRLQMDITDAPKALLPVSFQKRARSLTHIHLVNKIPECSASVSPAFAVHQNYLHTVTLIHVPIFKALVAPRLQHLTFIDQNCECPVDRLWRILSSTTNLRTLRLGADSITLREGNAQISFLPHLEYLMLYFDEDPDIHQLVALFDLLAAPSLQVMEFTAVSDLPIGNWDLVPCIKRKYPSVTTAIMYNVIYQTQEVQWFIESFPNIKHLTLDLIGLECCSRALAEFEQSPGDLDNQWGMLESVRVRIPPDLAEADRMDVVCDWLECRQQLGFPMLRLELVMDREDADRWEWLDPLRGWSAVSVVDPSEDFDAPWRFLEKYQGRAN